MKLTPAQLDRACGAVLGSAAGDALGAPYEFGLATVGPDGPRMIGGGLGDFAPGEWTDDTTMAWAILDVAATGADLRTEAALTQIARNFRDWYDSGPPDIGNQTRTILGAVGADPTGAAMTATSYDLHARTGHTAGNGSLMRTAPVALAYLDDPAALVEAARKVSALTHYDPHAQEACVLWSLAIRHAILHGEFDIRAGLAHLDDEAAAYWTERIDEAETSEPGRFRPNGWVVTALQAAWSAIVHTPVPDRRPGLPPPRRQPRHRDPDRRRHRHRRRDRRRAARRPLGRLGGPGRVAPDLHGYPGLTRRAARRARPPGRQQGARHLRLAARRPHRLLDLRLAPTLVRHPYDDGVWLADASALDDLPDDVTAVVSLCLVGRDQVRPDVEHVGFRLIDHADPAVNPNLDFVLADAARTVAALRDEGHVVLLHCVAAHSRTPTVGIAYAMLRGVDRAKALDRRLRACCRPRIRTPGFRAALKRLEKTGIRA